MASDRKARPYPRLSSFAIPEKAGENPLPERGVDAQHLAVFWVELVGAVVGRYRRTDGRDDLVEYELEDGTAVLAAPGKDGADALTSALPCVSAAGAPVPTKAEIRTGEGVAQLLHEILAPGASVVCDGECVHVAAGMTAQQAKRLLDSLDAHTGRAAPYSRRDSVSSATNWRRKFAALLRAPAETMAIQVGCLRRASGPAPRTSDGVVIDRLPPQVQSRQEHVSRPCNPTPPGPLTPAEREALRDEFRALAGRRRVLPKPAIAPPAEPAREDAVAPRPSPMKLGTTVAADPASLANLQLVYELCCRPEPAVDVKSVLSRVWLSAFGFTVAKCFIPGLFVTLFACALISANLPDSLAKAEARIARVQADLTRLGRLFPDSPVATLRHQSALLAKRADLMEAEAAAEEARPGAPLRRALRTLFLTLAVGAVVGFIAAAGCEEAKKAVEQEERRLEEDERARKRRASLLRPERTP